MIFISQLDNFINWEVGSPFNQNQNNSENEKLCEYFYREIPKETIKRTQRRKKVSDKEDYSGTKDPAWVPQEGANAMGDAGTTLLDMNSDK